MSLGNCSPDIVPDGGTYALLAGCFGSEIPFERTIKMNKQLLVSTAVGLVLGNGRSCTIAERFDHQFAAIDPNPDEFFRVQLNFYSVNAKRTVGCLFHPEPTVKLHDEPILTRYVH